MPVRIVVGLACSSSPIYGIRTLEVLKELKVETHLVISDGARRTIPIDASFFTVRLEPGCGSRMVLKMKRYVNQPTLIFPWDRN